MYCVPGAWSILDTNILDVNEQFKYFLSNSSEMLSVFSNLCCSLAIDYKTNFISLNNDSINIYWVPINIKHWAYKMQGI